MRLQVLVSTINQKDFSLLEKMNIKTDAVVINQCEENNKKIFEFKNKKIKWISQKEKGVGLSRNTALLNSDDEIILFADDDVEYVDNYEELVLGEFEKYPEADIILFNLKSLNSERPEYITEKPKKIYFYNSLRYGAFRVAAKREKLIKNNINFNVDFGGGAKYSAGEDNIFINDLLKNKFIVFASEKNIGTVEQKNSTWFKGYNKKYYFDRGCLFFEMYGKYSKILLFLFEIKKALNNKNNLNNENELSFIGKLKTEFEGVNEYKNTRIKQ